MGRPKGYMTPRKIKAADLLGEGREVKEVASIVGVVPKTVYEWLKEECFVDSLDLASRRYLARTVPKARRKLGDQIDDDNGWLAQNAANSVLRERSAVTGDASVQIVVVFGGTDIVPGMPANETMEIGNGE